MFIVNEIKKFQAPEERHKISVTHPEQVEIGLKTDAGHNVPPPVWLKFKRRGSAALPRQTHTLTAGEKENRSPLW